ncbi:hypothetical protein ACTWQF_10505 [Streptomyces sp. 8N114]|uniref:hypothetical protein n=1 Tax=Streptomyces sp. 8N114 TaxID=3457419 RepID=UPI003FD3904E
MVGQSVGQGSAGFGAELVRGRAGWGGHLGEALEKAVEGALAIVDGGAFLFGERNDHKHALQVGFGFDELGSRRFLGLGERVGREWLGPLAAVDYGGPLLAWLGTVVRLRRRPGGRPGRYARFDENLWWVRQEHQLSTMAAGLRVLSREKKAPGSGTNWRAVLPA